ncbi:hypothetical protein JCM4814A_65780 [Streptomyces phaeofaciens JCM 4814]|uniref:G domain-containing protein n=1 Tax=Streptomyces phaeofaciens TaxID=68254 RepID=A0A918LRE2_9ACTN|nr:hypothetical protein [Streptomyces phaeofaciens]GGT39370.1 hypothetical protein GCM10010226_14420 [Streptomyces phaeofaciens]
MGPKGAGEPAAAPAGALRDTADGLREPLRLAVAGQIKRGKSTLVNALPGERVALTGQLEVTFAVTFRLADTPGLGSVGPDSPGSSTGSRPV